MWVFWFFCWNKSCLPDSEFVWLPSWKSHQNWSCEVLEWRGWRVWGLVKRWKSCPKSTNIRLKWMLNKLKKNPAIFFLTTIRYQEWLILHVSMCNTRPYLGLWLYFLQHTLFCAPSSIHHGPTQLYTKLVQSSNF